MLNKLKNFFKNLWHFRKELWSFRNWDYVHNLRLFRRSLELTCEAIENGYEEEVSRDKKIVKIKRTIDLLTNFIEEDFEKLAEKELGLEYYHFHFNLKIDKNDLYQSQKLIDNEKISKKSYSIEKEQWNELWDTLKGRYDFRYIKGEGFEEQLDRYQETFDGSDMRGWWD